MCLGLRPESTRRKPSTFSALNVTYLRRLLICPRLFFPPRQSVCQYGRERDQSSMRISHGAGALWGLFNSHCCWPFQRQKCSVIISANKWCGLCLTRWHMLYCQILSKEQVLSKAKTVVACCLTFFFLCSLQCLEKPHDSKRAWQRRYQLNDERMKHRHKLSILEYKSKSEGFLVLLSWAYKSLALLTS